LQTFYHAGGEFEETSGGGQEGGIGDIASGVDFDKIKGADLSVGAAHAGGVADMVRSETSGAGTGRRGRIGAIEHIEIEIHIDAIDDLLELEQSIFDDITDAAPEGAIDGHDANAIGVGKLGISFGICEGLEADLDNVAPWQAIMKQRAYGVAVSEAMVEIAEIEVGIEREKAAAIKVAETMNSGASDAVVTAQQDDRVGLQEGRGNGVTNRFESLFRRAGGDGEIAQILRAKCAHVAAQFEVIGAEALEGFANCGGGKIAPAGRDRSEGHGSAEDGEPSRRLAQRFAGKPFTGARPISVLKKAHSRPTVGRRMPARLANSMASG
jgi:hypothetical protein